MLIIIIFLYTGSGQHVTCERSYYKLGCYQDRQWSRAMSELLISDRGESKQGQSVDWNNWEDYLHGLAHNASEEGLIFCYPAFSCLSYGTVAESTEPLNTSFECHQEKIRGQRGTLRALAGICRFL